MKTIQTDIKVGLKDAKELLKKSKKEFTELFVHKTFTVELYKPDKVDRQQPHTKDEVYVVVSGKGMFFCDGVTVEFEPGDMLFVPARAKHRFEDFSDDFITWVFFFGPEGGEK